MGGWRFSVEVRVREGGKEGRLSERWRVIGCLSDVLQCMRHLHMANGRVTGGTFNTSSLLLSCR